MATTSPIVIPVKTPGLSQLQKMEMRMKALEKTVEKLNADLLKNAGATKAAGRAAGTATGNIQRMGVAFRTTLGPVVALYGAINFLNKSLQVASQRQVNVAKLTNGLRNLGGTQADLEGLVDTADRLGKSTLFDQEDFTQNFALLTSFQRIGVDSYERVSKAAADLATITGQDLKSAQIQLAKALEDPAKRVTDLARSGTVFTDQQKEQIKVLQESGQLFEAQNLILQEIEKQYGGAAEAAGSAGLAGALDTLGEETRDFQESLVEATKAAELAEGAILLLAGQIKKAEENLETLNLVIRYFSENTDGAGEAVGWLVEQLGNLNAMAFQLLPGLGEVARLMGFIAGKQKEADGKKRLTNFGSNYASQEKALFEAAGGWTPYSNKPTPTPTPTPTSPKGSKGADAAAKAAEREAERVAKTLRDREQLVERLEKQLEIQNAVTDVGKETAKLELEILEINQKYDNLLKDETDELIRQNTERARALELEMAKADAAQAFVNNSSFGEMSQWYEEQSGMVQQLGGEYEQLASGIASDMTGAFKSIIDGSKSAEEAFSEMLKNMANRFLDMAMQILQDALTQQLMGLFGSLFGGIGGGAGGGFGVTPATSGMSFFAEGGFVTGPTQAMLGEAGEPEYAIPQSKMASAMERYSQGMRGEAVTAGASEYGDQSESGMGGGAATAIDVSYTVSQINSVNYVTEESFRQGMARAAADGAKAGEARTLGRLRSSVGVRRKLGMS